MDCFPQAPAAWTEPSPVTVANTARLNSTALTKTLQPAHEGSLGAGLRGARAKVMLNGRIRAVDCSASSDQPVENRGICRPGRHHVVGALNRGRRGDIHPIPRSCGGLLELIVGSPSGPTQAHSAIRDSVKRER